MKEKLKSYKYIKCIVKCMVTCVRSLGISGLLATSNMGMTSNISSTNQSHSGSIYVYIKVILAGSYPWV